jgi:1,4-dihydroxy-2-naphthoate octaprenyltransferase
VAEVLAATRPWSFSMTAVSVALGVLAAAGRGSFRPWLALATLAGAVAVHAGTNLANDYCDYTQGLDTPESPTARYRRHRLVDGTLAPAQVRAGAAAMFAAATAIGVGLAALRGWAIAALTAAGDLAGYCYSARPVRLKERALGELTAFLMWGPCMVLGAFIVQTGGVGGALPALALSAVQGAWVALVLLANNLKDVDFDRRRGVRTIAVILGLPAARRLFAGLLVAVYALIAVLVALAVVSPWALAAFGSAPLAVRLARRILAAREIPADADPLAARTALAFGVALAAGLAVSLRFVP